MGRLTERVHLYVLVYKMETYARIPLPTASLHRNWQPVPPENGTLRKVLPVPKFMWHFPCHLVLCWFNVFSFFSVCLLLSSSCGLEKAKSRVEHQEALAAPRKIIRSRSAYWVKLLKIQLKCYIIWNLHRQ